MRRMIQESEIVSGRKMLGVEVRTLGISSLDSDVQSSKLAKRLAQSDSAAFQQIVEPADAIPSIPIALEHDSMPSIFRVAMIVR